MNDSKKIIAFIPARSGSKRIPNKNLYLLNGHPLIAYSIQAALNSNVFDSVVCVTDDEQYAKVAEYYGAEVPFLRPIDISTDTSPDIEWLKWILNELDKLGRTFDIYSILRPTSPFRKSSTIIKAFEEYFESGAEGLRAVQKCKEHPGKMWIKKNNRIIPLINESIDNTPMHSHQYATLPVRYIQNASLEICKTLIPIHHNKIIGDDIYPFINENLEGFDINSSEDIILMNYHVMNQNDILENINLKPFSF